MRHNICQEEDEVRRAFQPAQELKRTLKIVSVHLHGVLNEMSVHQCGFSTLKPAKVSLEQLALEKQPWEEPNMAQKIYKPFVIHEPGRIVHQAHQMIVEVIDAISQLPEPEFDGGGHGDEYVQFLQRRQDSIDKATLPVLLDMKENSIGTFLYLWIGVMNDTERLRRRQIHHHYI
ncbi:hypothetical protein DM02DRAFT_682076 [Periconia macrospinosa]|uniref:Uncharacterized protein n=1 Tax=Periconia macrospinosa TaxID=97972 RepID=A0A2V1DMS5_9PLEO|nr:hypothetical protein DM02DRAFT_682076 [Periconia macrospinosa]